MTPARQPDTCAGLPRAGGDDRDGGGPDRQ
jgi:hypothetical protein